MWGGFKVVFKGESDSECTDFIRAVRMYAKKKAKAEDNNWIAKELYDAFSGKALKWYLLLPPEVRGDWERLQLALLYRWTQNKDTNNTTVGPGCSPSAGGVEPMVTSEDCGPPAYAHLETVGSKSYIRNNANESGLATASAPACGQAITIIMAPESRSRIITRSPSRFFGNWSERFGVIRRSPHCSQEEGPLSNGVGKQGDIQTGSYSAGKTPGSGQTIPATQPSTEPYAFE